MMTQERREEIEAYLEFYRPSYLRECLAEIDRLTDENKGWSRMLRNAIQMGLNEGSRPVRGLRNQLNKISSQYRKLKATSRQRKEMIDFMIQFLSPEELDRVYHGKREPKRGHRDETI